MICETNRNGSDTICANITYWNGVCEKQREALPAVCSCLDNWDYYRRNTCWDRPVVDTPSTNCTLNKDDYSLYCLCDDSEVSFNFTGIVCDMTRYSTSAEMARTDQNTKEIVIPLAVSSVFLIILILILLRQLIRSCKHRASWYIKWTLNYHVRFSDTADLPFDVFVSHVTSEDDDRSFVVHNLWPFLQKELHYSVCFEEKNFLPGAAYADCIMEGIQKSKRTILVLSPAYVRAHWPHFEMHCAVKETLKSKHRLVPLIYKPIHYLDNDTSLILRHILETIPHLEWPGDDETPNKILQKEFWRQLKKALPKRKKQVNGSDTSTDTNTLHSVIYNDTLHVKISI